MSDQGLWFKLWCSSVDDSDLDNLDIADFGRWAKLGTYIKQHGQSGSIAVRAPARTLCSMLQVPDFRAFHVAVSRLPNVKIEEIFNTENGAVSSETTLTVTFCNWMKYQGDFSTQRVRKHREMKHELKRSRGEERRREEKRGEENYNPPIVPHTENGADTRSGKEAQSKGSTGYSDGFGAFWEMYPRKVGKGAAWRIWEKDKLEGHMWEIGERVSLALAENDQWHEEEGRFIPNPATYLHQRRWEDELPGDRERERKRKAAHPEANSINASNSAAERGS